MTHTYTVVPLPISLGAFEEIRGLLMSAGYHDAFHREGDDIFIDMAGIAITRLHAESPAAEGIERIMATEPESCLDIKAGTFYVTDEFNTEKTLDFYVRTCREPENFEEGSNEARSKRQDDLNEQYTDVAWRLMHSYQERVRYVRVTPDPFF